ncbi:MAG: response regulator [Bacteroidales bacterium]|nr:response regulator [Bacteroidales bacterium]
MQILHAWNGEEAVQMVKDNPNIALVLMDIRMPVMDGYTATGKIKKMRPDLPVIAQTAFAFSEDKEKAMKVGFDNYITKPSPKKMIVDVLEGYLN